MKKKLKGKRYAAKIILYEKEYEYEDPITPMVSESLHVSTCYKGQTHMYKMICSDEEGYQRELFTEYIKEAVSKALLEGAKKK